ncbi:MAG: HD domain-containing protein [Alphaproteobacteria bacterium]
MKKFDEISEILGLAKDLKRSGWVKRNIENPENIPSHSWGVAMLVILLCPSHLNKLRCLEMAIIHDIVEIITGDHTPDENISEKEKYEAELVAVKEISYKLQKPELIGLFIEFEKQKTEEAKFVKQLDKLEAVVQAAYYDKHRQVTHYQSNSKFSSLFEEFETYARDKISHLFEQLNV